VINELGYDPIRADQDVGALIITQMIERLYFADLVLAEMNHPERQRLLRGGGSPRRAGKGLRPARRRLVEAALRRRSNAHHPLSACRRGGRRGCGASDPRGDQAEDRGFGKRWVARLRIDHLDFAREFLLDDYDEVRHIFSRRGAYRRYKDLLVRRGALERWYDFSNKSEETALREWCAENGIELSDT